MESISNADLFVALLRQKLAERTQAKGAGRKRTEATSKAREAEPHRPVAALAAQAGADDRHLRRTIVEQLLTERFGAKLANEPRFQQVVEQVTEILAGDPELGALLGEVMRKVRG